MPGTSTAASTSTPMFRNNEVSIQGSPSNENGTN